MTFSFAKGRFCHVKAQRRENMRKIYMVAFVLALASLKTAAAASPDSSRNQAIDTFVM